MRIEPVRICEPSWPVKLKRLEDLPWLVSFLSRDEVEAIYPKAETQ